MSKTSDGSLVRATAIAYWKQFVGLVTGYAHRYKEDSFLRTEVNLVALQAAYAAIVIAVSITSLVVLYSAVLHTVTGALILALSNSAPPTPGGIAKGLAAVRTRTMIELASVIVATAAVFGYLVTRFALAPARNALVAQKRFIGDVAHELRTPLAIIRTNTEVRLLDRDVSKEARELHVSNLEELDRISGLINNLLTLNTFLRPQDMPFGNVDLGKLASRAIERLSTLAERRKVRLTLYAAADQLAWGNAAALEQILMNVIKNAIQHTEDGDVRITIGPSTSGALELVVSDTGSGIKREDLAHIFEPFYRGDRARARVGGAGSGLGLAIVSELVRLHKGRIRIQSAPEIGTRVTVTLPFGHMPRSSHITSRMKRPGTLEEAAADFGSEGGMLS